MKNRNKKSRDRKVYQHSMRRDLNLYSVPIIIRFPFQAKIEDEYKNFKCVVLDSNLTNDVNNICKFDQIVTKTVNEITGK